MCVCVCLGAVAMVEVSGTSSSPGGGAAVQQDEEDLEEVADTSSTDGNNNDVSCATSSDGRRSSSSSQNVDEDSPPPHHTPTPVSSVFCKSHNTKVSICLSVPCWRPPSGIDICFANVSFFTTDFVYTSERIFMKL